METVQHNRPELLRLIEAEAKRKKRRAWIERAITNQIFAALMSLLDGLWLMLAVGIAHAEWIPALPTIGYWWSVLLVALLRGCFSKLDFPAKKDGAK